MQDPVSSYLGSLQRELSTGHAQEHSYRPALKALCEAITKLTVVNEPKGSAYGRPDLIMVRGDVPLAWAEAKDLHVSLDKVEKSEQMDRYFGYANLILTNGLEFRFYKNGKRYGEPLVLAVKDGTQIAPRPDAHAPFVRVLTAFVEEPADTIRSAEHLAKIMGGKASRLRDNIREIVKRPNADAQPRQIEKIRDVLKSKLIHDLSDEAFADLYAQTLVYGLFVARYHDDSPENFTRAEARDRIPASNHLLQEFFDHIAGPKFEKQLSFIVDELCEVFLHADVKGLVHGLFLKKGDSHDPIIHFYEDFLREYDPELRSARGVFYTPLPVVHYIVRSVDALLKEHFDLSGGLADRATTTVTLPPTQNAKKGETRTIDRVQILDPAAGTGTFLNEVIRFLHEGFKGQEGMWPAFVNDHLIGRLNGFELMMASYTIAHLKLGMTLAETGVTDLRRRLRVFLTNSLEEAPTPDDSMLPLLGFQEAITEEGHQAAEVKRDLPIMVVLGNPPYSVSSQNASTEIGPDGKKRKTWIGTLIDDYKKDLNEKKLNLDDDYIKFIRLAQDFIQKNRQGVVAMITNNSFLDGVTHRRMRESLLETFDDIYIVNLHGDSNKKEITPEGAKDENVFDIKQGVSISLFVRSSTGKKKFGTVHHIDLYGNRQSKYEWLEQHNVVTTQWTKLEPPEPNYFYVPKNFEHETQYSLGMPINELFVESNTGIQTKRDDLFIGFTKQELSSRFQDIAKHSVDQSYLAQTYSLENSSGWNLSKLANLNHQDSKIIPIFYRPFDVRWVYFDPSLLGRARESTMRHMIPDNLGLVTLRINGAEREFVSIAVKTTIEKGSLPRGNYSLFPVYLYSNATTISGEQRTANLNAKLLFPVLKKLAFEWIADGSGDGKKTCGPEDIFDYLYAVLHCPTYRSRYKDFLKIDFPRVPFTSNPVLFWQLVALGREVRHLHLLESPLLGKHRTTYPIAGSNTVEKVRFDGSEMGNVWINATQYFGNVPKLAWEFYVGGYQPAQKWLKDRKGRTLTSDDLHHYQCVIVALCETDRLMKEIDAAIEVAGGWPMK